MFARTVNVQTHVSMSVVPDDDSAAVNALCDGYTNSHSLELEKNGG